MTNKKKLKLKKVIPGYTVNVIPNPTVSIITITQLKRNQTLLLLAEHIKNQTYRNIVEWVIVDGCNNIEESLKNELLINELLCTVKINYIPGYTVNEGVYSMNNNKLGELRNIGNRSCVGDITVCMDDDDYYPPTRVEHVVTKLSESKYLIAGCSCKYLYDYCLQKFFLFKSFGEYHSTNDCMAWKKEYLLDNSHDPNAASGEEASFTKKFKNPMVQLDSVNTIISSSHSQNTYNKKEICIYGCLKESPGSDKYLYPFITHPDFPVTDLIDHTIFEQYSRIFNIPTESEYSITYFCGGTSIEWNPEDQSLGGYEQAIVNICAEWALLGKKVAVYAKITKEINYKGVDYFDWKKFPFSQQHQVLVLWRMQGVNCALQFPIKCNRLFVDYHDNNFGFRFDYLKYSQKIDTIFFKSDFHREYYQNHFKLELKDKEYKIIPNGIRVSDFNINPGNVRDPFRFCYCSNYTRGLVELLQYVWPVIFREYPHAELHVYYGMDSLDKQQQQQLTLLMGQPGVMDHSRRPMKDIIAEKWRSTFQLYITDYVGEIDCISIRESLVTGCIPLISNSGVFKNREGIHFELVKTQDCYHQIAQKILILMGKSEFLEMVRQKFKKSPTIVDWETVAGEWIRCM